MKLEFADYPVKDIRFGRQTSYSDGVLQINKKEILDLILEDKHILTAGLSLALPGTKTRIVNLRDAVEPRIKVAGPGCVFPGVLGPIETGGEGRTNRMSGIAVLASADLPAMTALGPVAQNAGTVDMWGPVSEVTPYGALRNVVLTLKLGQDMTEMETHNSILMAELKAAHRLAQTTVGKKEATLETFATEKNDPSLPNVVYILGVVTQWHVPHSGIALYGVSVRESLPTLIHPNEILDGAITTDARRGSGMHPMTWAYMNSPVVLGLLREHGKRLNFLGVIFQRTRFEAESGKQLTAAVTAQMAKLMGADGAILTRISPSGNNLMDSMWTVQACEKKGVKTVFITPEYGGKDGSEMPLQFNVPEAVSMVSTSSLDRLYEGDVPEVIIGGIGAEEMATTYLAEAPFPARQKIVLAPDNITDGADWLGFLNWTNAEY